tara:strand:+ start:343 stop:1908 length:1566 start_codon:yes stop_codon:yes gene_type:complete
MKQSFTHRQWILLTCLGIQLAGWLWITLLSRGVGSAGFAYEVDNDATPTWLYFWIQFSLGLVILLTFTLLRKKPLPGKAVWITVVTGAMLLRFVAVFGEPIHESDFYRYIWDGNVTRAGVNPYRLEPGALLIRENEIHFTFDDPTTGVPWRGRKFSAEEEESLSTLQALRDLNPRYFERISHPAVTTIYPPVAQGFFWLTQVSFDHSLMGFRAWLVGIDIAVIVILLSLLKRFHLPPVAAILYGWNPLPIKEFANSAHYDVLAILFMLAAIGAAISIRSRLKATISVVGLIALGTLTKYFAVLLLPILLIYLAERNDRKRRRLTLHLKDPHHWIAVTGFVTLLGLAFFPWLSWQNAGSAEVFRGLQTYGKFWEYNQGGFALIMKGVQEAFAEREAFQIARKMAAALLCLTVAIMGLFSQRPIAERCFVALAALFVLSPTAFPWYFCWALAFVPFQPRLSWVIFSLLLPLNYIDFHSNGSTPLANQTFHGFHLTQLIIWGTFFLIWIAESILNKRSIQKSLV